MSSVRLNVHFQCSHIQISLHLFVVLDGGDYASCIRSCSHVVEGGGGSESSKGYVNVLDGDVVGVDVAQNGGIAFCD